MTGADFRAMRVLVTGAAGFIGMHTARALLAQGAQVVGVDSFDPYYDVPPEGGAARDARRHRRASRSSALDLADAEPTARLFARR